MTKEIGTIDEFHSKHCYELYLYAVTLAKQINEYIESGYLVVNIEENYSEFLTNPFKFYLKDEPAVAISCSKNSTNVWVGFVYDDEGKIWLTGEVTKKYIKKMFSKIKICDPKNFIKLKF